MTVSLYGLVAEFATSQQLLEALRQIRAKGYRHIDAHTPFAVEGLAEALQFRDNWLPFIMLLGGILGAVLAFGLQYYAWVIDYPLNSGGRPLNSWPPFLLPTFEITILSAALAGMLGMLARNRLPKPYHSVFNTPYFDRASQDRFYLCIEAKDERFQLETTRQFLLDQHPLRVYEVER